MKFFALFSRIALLAAVTLFAGQAAAQSAPACPTENGAPRVVPSKSAIPAACYKGRKWTWSASTVYETGPACNALMASDHEFKLDKGKNPSACFCEKDGKAMGDTYPYVCHLFYDMP